MFVNCRRSTLGLLLVFSFIGTLWFSGSGAVCAGGIEPEPDTGLIPVRIALQWLPQSQFAGFYMARDRGFFRDAGLAVDLLHTGPGPSSLDFLVDGRADFATMFLADAMTAADASTPLVNIAQLLKRSNLMLVAWKDMGIEHPADLDGQRVSYWPGAFSAAFKAFFQQHGIVPDARAQHYTVNLFLHRAVAACSAMVYNEYHRIYQAGIDYDQLTVFMMRDDGLGFPEDGIYTTETIARNQPSVCLAVRQATLRGWEYARDYPDDTIEAVLRESRQAGVPANRPHSRWMLAKVIASIFPADDDSPAGQLDRAAYQRTADALIAAGLIDQAPAFERFAPFEQETP